MEQTAHVHRVISASGLRRPSVSSFLPVGRFGGILES